MLEESFTSLINELKLASDKRDWDQLSVIDKKIKTEIKLSIDSAKSEKQKSHLAMLLKRVQKIYDLLIAGSENHRDEISAELSKLTKDQKAVNIYLDSSSYSG